MRDIKNYNTFTKIEAVNKGWSNDKKYYIETDDGRRLLLRMRRLMREAMYSQWAQQLSPFSAENLTGILINGF